MNEQNEFPTPGQSNHAPESGTQPEAEAFAFCQTCGRPLTQQAARVVGQSVFCEPCLEARVAAASGIPPFGTPPAGASAYPGYTPESSAAWVPGSTGTPNPGLATLLGFIPGVGAMYNEQYAKGIVHLIVFAVLVTVADSFGIFGLFVAGWEFYMAIDANHTARARRDGLPLPNPFGLNDIGERLGFGKAWLGNPNVAAAAQQAARAAAQQASQAMRDAADFASQASGRSAAQAPFVAPNPGPANPYNQTQNWGPTYTGSTPPAYNPAYPVDIPHVAAAPQSRFPAGAVWLIGLGCVFLLATTGLFNSIHPHVVLGIILIGLAGWIFTRRMAESGLSLQSSPAYETPAGYHYRVFRALRVSVWLAAIGLWFLLDAARWLPRHTWPLILIVAGVMALLDRVLLNAAQAEPPPAPAVAGNGDWSAPSTVETEPAEPATDPTKGGR